MKNNLHALKALPTIFLIAFSVLQSCKNLDEPLPTPGHPSQIKDKWRVSRLTNHYHGLWKKTLDFKYNAFNKAAIFTEFSVNQDGDTTTYAYETFEYNAQQQLLQSHRHDSTWNVIGMPDSSFWLAYDSYYKFSYDAAGRITKFNYSVVTTGETDTSTSESPVTYEGDSVVYYNNEKFTFDQNGNMTKREGSNSSNNQIIGPYDHSPNVNALTTVPRRGLYSSLPIFSKNNPTQVISENSTVKYQYVYNKDSLATKRTTIDDNGAYQTEYYEYIKVE